MLLNNATAAQSLGLMTLNQHCKRDKLNAFKRWVTETQRDKIAQKERKLRNTMELIIEFRAKLKGLNEENNVVVAENEELRQRALDGIMIAKTAQELSEQREQLCVDLADKGVLIKRLIEGSVLW